MLRSSCKPNWNIQISFLLNPEKKGGERVNVGIFSLTLTGEVNVEVFVRDKYWFSPYGGLMLGFLV